MLFRSEPHVLQIVFTGTPPTKWNGDIVLYTAGDIECATLVGWTTVYRDEGQTVYLSDDGSVYQTPDPDSGEVLPPEPYVPTLAELQSVKKREISQACERIIYSGVDVTFTDGSVEHFSLTEHDQLNLFGKQVQLAAGAEQLDRFRDIGADGAAFAAHRLFAVQAAAGFVYNMDRHFFFSPSYLFLFPRA